MMFTAGPDPSRRAISAAAALLLQLLILYALILGFSLSLVPRTETGLSLVDVAAPPPPPPPEPIHRIASHRPNGAAAPANLRAQATEIVMPPLPIPIPQPPPVAAAPVPFQGNQASQGAAPVPGPGTGAGGIGNGPGSGTGGNGDGNGIGGGSPPRWLHGRLKDSDYPREAGEAGVGGTVSVRYSVELDGHVGQCFVTHGSGNGALDRTTCALIQQRFRYRPGTDSNGHPIRSWIIEEHSWVSYDDTPATERR